MDGDRFDGITRTMAEGASRRRVLKILGAAFAGGVGASRAVTEIAAAPACRGVGHPCEGNQVCCDGLVCTPGAGPGKAARCTVAPTTTTTTTTLPPSVCPAGTDACLGLSHAARPNLPMRDND